MVVAAFALAGCFQPTHPSAGHLRPEPAAVGGETPPPVQTTTVLPQPQPATRPETYSVVVNNVPVQELLFALARDAKLNVDIHPGIGGKVTLNAVDQTLPQLLNRIARQADIRWELDGVNLAVMRDSPYLRVYRVDYVNIERQTLGQVGISSRVQSGSAATPGAQTAATPQTGPGLNASNVSVRNQQANRFWETLIANIGDLLREADRVVGGAPAATGAAFREAASVIPNAETGVIAVRATARQHERLQEFLDQVLANARRQVLIEATIVEVVLSDNYQQGIDWSHVRESAGRMLSIRQSPQGELTANPTGSVFVMDYASGGLSGTIRLLESFGDVRVLSSPRLAVLNNQTALLRVADDRVYFQVSAQTSQATNAPSVSSISTTAQTVSVGFVMNVTPQVSDADGVIINVRPSVTRIIGFVNDPNPLLAAANVVNRVPEIQTRELESIIRVASGDIAVMGGLIQDEIRNSEDFIPLVHRIPVIGNFFGNRNLASRKTELVIFIRPVVVKDASLDGDYRAYRAFVPGDDFLREPHPARRGGTDRGETQ